MERHGIQNKLKRHLTNYWGERLLAQLLYLEEVNAVKAGKYDGLLDECTEKLYQAYRLEGCASKSDAHEIEGRLLAASADAKQITVSCVAHAHIDMNWMWRFDETVAVTLDTLRTMLKLMDEYPDFTFSQSQASVYKIIEEFAPELLPQIRKRIAEGRWEAVASTWVETDKNMPSGESLARHILYTRRYLKKLLGLSDDQFQIDFEPDTFGHGLNVPEIMSKGGVKYYYHCRGYDGHHLYRWRSPSGAEVTVFRDPTWYMDAISAGSFMYIPSFCAKNSIDRMIHVYGVGDHGGGATRRDIERIIDCNAWPCMPKLEFGRYMDFYRYMDTLDLPVVDGELNFVFDGCYTTQTRIKKANRVAEAALYEAESLNAVSALHGAYGYSAEAFAAAWENVLFNHFHDILPGSGVIGTREYALGLFQKTMACAGSRKAAAVRGISSLIDTEALLPANSLEGVPESTSEGAGAGFGAASFNFTGSSGAAGDRRLFHLFNTTHAVKKALSMITVWDWPGDLGKTRITGENGEEIPHQLVDAEIQHYWGHRYFRVLCDCELPAFGYRTVMLSEAERFCGAVLSNDMRVDREGEFVLENDYVRAAFDRISGGLISFIDKESGFEYASPKDAGGAFRLIEESDAGMTAWRIGRYMSKKPICENARISPVAGILQKSFSYEVEFGGSKLAATVSLEKNSRMIRYDVKCDWREFAVPKKSVPQLSFGLPLGFACDTFAYDAAFGVVERAGRDYDVPGQSFAFAAAGADGAAVAGGGGGDGACSVREDGAGNGCEGGDSGGAGGGACGGAREDGACGEGGGGCEDSGGARGGLMLVTDSKYGFRCCNGGMSVTLIRSSFEPDPIPECYEHEFSFGIGIMRDGSAKALIDASADFRHPAITVAAGSQKGCLPPAGSFLNVASTSGDIVISAIKMAENGDGALIVRAYEANGKDASAALDFCKAPARAVYADTHENELPGKTPAVSGNTVTADFPSKAVTAIKVWF